MGKGINHDNNIVHFTRKREKMESFSQKFQKQMHVTESLVRRLGLETELEGHSGCVNCLEWNESGRILASASDDVQVIFWDPFRHKKLHTIQTGHRGNVFSVKFLPNSNDRILVTCAGDCLIRVHDIILGETTQSCGCHAGRVKRIATAPSVPYMIWSASEDGTVMQFDLRAPHSCNGSVKNVLVNLVNHCGHDAEAKCIAVNPFQEEIIAVGANDPFVRLYDRRMIKLTDLQNSHSVSGSSGDHNEILLNDNLLPGCVNYFVAGHLPFIYKDYKRSYRNFLSTYLTFGPNGKDLLVNIGGEQIYLFDVGNKRKVKKFDCEEVSINGWKSYKDNCSPLNYNQCTVSSNNNFPSDIVYSLYPSGTWRLPYSVENLKISFECAFETSQYTLAIKLCNEAISQYPHFAFLYYNRASAYMKRDWDGDNYAAMRDCYSALQLDANFMRAHYRLAKCMYKMQWMEEAYDCLEVFNAKFPTYAQKGFRNIDGKDFNFVKEFYDIESDCDAESSDNQLVCPPNTAEFLSPLEKYWRENTFDYETRFCGHCNTTTDIKEANFFGSEGQFIVAGSDDGSFFIWDRKTTNIMRVLRGDDSIVNCLQPHPTYCLLATSGIDPVVRLWSPRPEDGTKNEREVLNSYDAASANQRRMNADPFEVMLINMGYRLQVMRDEPMDASYGNSSNGNNNNNNSNGNNNSSEESEPAAYINCRPS